MRVKRVGLADELADGRIAVVDRFLPVSVCGRMLRETTDGDWVSSRVASSRGQGLATPVNGRSSSTLVADRYSPWMEAALRRIEESLRTLYGVRPTNLEPWQMTRYKCGEAFDYHLDCGRWRGHPSGERRRTILIYLEQPIRGGATDFRALGNRIRPIVGRLVVWENLLANGNCNHGMIHSSRPVWQGCKTTLATWERERSYML